MRSGAGRTNVKNITADQKKQSVSGGQRDHKGGNGEDRPGIRKNMEKGRAQQSSGRETDHGAKLAVGNADRDGEKGAQSRADQSEKVLSKRHPHKRKEV